MNNYLIGLLVILGSGAAYAADSPAGKEQGARPRAEARPHPAPGADRGVKPRARAKQHFERLDKDNSGSISHEEVKGHPRWTQDFGAMDVNHDGQVSPAEYGDYVKSHVEQPRDKMKREAKARWDKADANDDGALSRDEAKNSPLVAEHFEAMDADKNGQVSAQEVAAYMKAQHPRDGANPR